MRSTVFHRLGVLAAAAVLSATGAQADTFTYDATISPTPGAAVTDSQFAAVSFAVPDNFGDFSSIQGIHFDVSFTDDLLNTGETFFLCNPGAGTCYGRGNGSADPVDAFTTTWNGDQSFFAGTGMPNGGDVTFQAQMGGSGQAVDLAAVTMTVDGTAVPEPASILLSSLGLLACLGVFLRSSRRPVAVRSRKNEARF